MDRFLIVNADDFGASPGINRGILECHTQGVLTSASLMTRGSAREAAAALSREHPALSVGLHFEACDEHGRELDLEDVRVVGRELEGQVGEFEGLLGQPPTHLDSHHHAHREEQLRPLFQDAARNLGVPLRDEEVAYVGGFYAQWEWKVTELRYVSVEFLEHLLREEVSPGWTEIACHPGYVEPELPTEYASERAAEVRTLTDPRIRSVIGELGIRLASYADYGEARAQVAGQ